MKYEIQLPSGFYWLNDPVTVEAKDEEEALILASIKDPKAHYLEASDISEDEESDERYCYLDRTEYGHSCIYLLIDNAQIKEVA